MLFKKSDALEQLKLEMKKYGLKEGDLIVATTGIDVPEEVMISIQAAIATAIEEIGVNQVSMLLMTDPMQIFRLDPSDMAVLGWFRMDEVYLDRLNSIGVINFTELMTLKMMVKKLESMRPKDTAQLMDRKMTEIKRKSKYRKNK